MAGGEPEWSQWLAACDRIAKRGRSPPLQVDFGTIVKCSVLVGRSPHLHALLAPLGAARQGRGQVRFEQRDVAKRLPGRYDVITTFAVVHDAADPRGQLSAIHQALTPDGIYVCLDINCSDKLEENLGPKGSCFHGVSVLLCMTMSLAEHGQGLGTLGLHAMTLQELCAEVGFGAVRNVPIATPFNNLYEIRASAGGL